MPGIPPPSPPRIHVATSLSIRNDQTQGNAEKKEEKGGIREMEMENDLTEGLLLQSLPRGLR